MSKFQKGDRVKQVEDGEVVLVSHVGDKFYTMLRLDGTAYETQIQSDSWQFVTESLTELPPVMGERLVYNGSEVTYLDFSDTQFHYIKFKSGFIDNCGLTSLSRPKRTRSVSKVVYYNAKLALAVGNPYVVQGAGDPYPDGWVKVAEFSHEVAT